jgi:hypothetical protein
MTIGVTPIQPPQLAETGLLLLISNLGMGTAMEPHSESNQGVAKNNYEHEVWLETVGLLAVGAGLCVRLFCHGDAGGGAELSAALRQYRQRRGDLHGQLAGVE